MTRFTQVHDGRLFYAEQPISSVNIGTQSLRQPTPLNSTDSCHKSVSNGGALLLKGITDRGPQTVVGRVSLRG